MYSVLKASMECFDVFETVCSALNVSAVPSDLEWVFLKDFTLILGLIHIKYSVLNSSMANFDAFETVCSALNVFAVPSDPSGEGNQHKNQPRVGIFKRFYINSEFDLHQIVFINSKLKGSTSFYDVLRYKVVNAIKTICNCKLGMILS